MGLLRKYNTIWATPDNLESTLSWLREEICSGKGQIGLDTETYGLAHHDQLFMLILAANHTSFIFNFHDYGPAWPDYPALDRSVLTKELLDTWQMADSSTLGIHNAIFDLGMLLKCGVEPKNKIHCTKMGARLIYNVHQSYSLNSCAGRIGLAKDAAVDQYINMHRLYTNVKVDGKVAPIKLKHFEKVPPDIMKEYAGMDAMLHLTLMEYQKDVLSRYYLGTSVVQTAMAVIPIVAKMRHKGIKIDRDYCQNAKTYHTDEAFAASTEYEQWTGCNTSSRKGLIESLTSEGLSLPMTLKGNLKIDSKSIDVAGNESNTAKLIIKVRENQKLAGTYYSAFLHHSESDGCIHANLDPAGTKTLRWSCSEPNLQNLTKEDDTNQQYYVRKCFIPRQGHIFVMVDFNQQEFRMMLDYAGEAEVIKAIMENGLDVHQSVADGLSCPRSLAKPLNFGLVYGIGSDNLGKNLGMTSREAQVWKEKYFQRYKKVKDLIKTVPFIARQRGYIKTWSGRREYLPTNDTAYAMPNHLIQGGCADVLDRAIIKNEAYIKENNLAISQVLPIHDELIFEVPTNEVNHVKALVDIMENIYISQNGLKLTCSVSWSSKSMASIDRIKGFPDGL